ncbi:MAG TPA: enoyl-CoA hydratase family protein [Micromonosporaceae bacterium]|jgi:enoyl-CoA hydratase|nr:enoyl-CoA hydratase family protein [Micromonosporaceae bacterium]
MTDELVHLDVMAGVGTITLDSPHNRNALSRQLVGELSQRLDAAAQDSAVRAVVLTHTGGTFCAGADLGEAREGGMAEGTKTLLRLLRDIVTLPKPVVGRIDGNVRAGGLGLVGACDIVIASESSSFAFTEARLGLTPAIISLTVLPRLDSRAAGRYFLTGERFGGAVAERIGLVTCSAADVEAVLEEILAGLRAGSPQGLAESKRLVTGDVLARLEQHGDEMVELSARLFGSEEALEGMTSFLQRRPPRWAVGGSS